MSSGSCPAGPHHSSTLAGMNSEVPTERPEDVVPVAAPVTEAVTTEATASSESADIMDAAAPGRLPSMGDLDALSADLDQIDATLADLNRQSSPS